MLVMKYVPAGAVALLAFGVLTSCGATEPDITVKDATVRVPANPDVTAGYLTIENNGGADDALTGATADSAEKVQMHDTENKGGGMTMEKRDEVAVDAGDTVKFETGGLHLMLMEPEKLKAGDTVELSLKFAKSGTMRTDASVEPASGSHG